MKFDEFWAAYPLKKGRREAEKSFGRLSDAEREQVAESLPLQVREWAVHGTDKMYMPRASTWLNQARYEDEFEIEAPKEKQTDWWRSQTGIEAEARNRGCYPARPGESQEQWVARIRTSTVRMMGAA